MRLAGKLVRDVLAALLPGWLLAGYVYSTAFPLVPEVPRLPGALVLAAFAAQAALVAALLARAAAPLLRAERRGATVDAAASAAAAEAGRRLAPIAAALLGGTSLAATGAWVLTFVRRGMPGDLALAAASVGTASAILAAMLGYSLVAAAAVRTAGGRDVAPRGTVRTRILVLGFALNGIGVLLFAATGYLRYRADVDREYVAAAVRAHEGAVATAASGGDAEVAEHVWVVTGSPAALVGPRGEIAARFGAGEAPFDRAHGAPVGGVRLEDGWLVTSRAPGGGLVASWLPEAPLWPRRRAFWGELAALGLIAFAVTAALAWLAARAIAFPLRVLGLAADRIASGDLTAAPPSPSQDEMGQLAAEFGRMAQGLKGLVLDVQAASEGVSLGARDAAAIGDRVRGGALEQHAGVVSVQGAVEAMEGSMRLVSHGLGGLSEYVNATTRAMGEMAEAFEEVRRKGGDLERAMAAAAGDVEHLSAAGRDAEGRLAGLEALAGHAGARLPSVRASMETLERAAEESEATAALVVEIAERAGGVVEETVHGIETLREAVADAHRRVTALGRRSDDIGQVVDFISEVAGRTNLLSLNASIIAAQAGEHGKAFGVVAEQIRELAAQIARSTHSIGDIIRSVRDDVGVTAALIDRGDALAADGVRLARNSLAALGQIRRSTAQGRETAVAIHAAVDAHAVSSREVSQVVESVADGSRAVSAAVQLMGRSVAGVNSMSRSVGAMADQVARALEEHSGLGQRQLDSLGRLEQMIAEITRAVANHAAATRRVRDALQSLSHTAGEHEAAVDGLTGVAGRLGARAKALAENVGRFKV
jgi:methyl-accepting chemotaxis protein